METQATRNVILVIAGGWVIICRQSLADPTKVFDARVIIRWGTTEGLAQIALHGPTAETKLGEACNGEVPVASVTFTLYVADGVKWTG